MLCGLRQGVLSSQCGHLISFGTKYLMSLQCGVPSGRLPRYARNDKVLRTEWKRMKSIAKTDKVFVWFILCHSEELHCNDVRIPRKGTLLYDLTQRTLRQYIILFAKNNELKKNQLKYQYNSFVNFNQLLSYIPKSTALYFHVIFSCIYIY